MQILQPTNGISNGTQSFSGAKTFSTSVTSPLVTATSSVSTSSTTATSTVSNADGLTIGGLIVPQYVVISQTLNALSVSQALLIADAAYQVVGVRAVWGIAGGLSAVINVEKLTGTTVPGSGTALLSSDIDITTTANTVASGSLTGTVSSLQLAVGNRLGVKLGGTLTGLVGCCVTITLKRI